jgi:hypothetical protein
LTGQCDRKDPAIFLGVDQVAQFAAEVERQGCGVGSFHDLGVRMLAQEPGGKQDARKLGFGRARRQIDNHALQLTTLDALKHLRHDVMVAALDKLGEHRTHERQEMLACLSRIGSTSAQESIQVLGELGALCGGEALVIEKPCIKLEPAALAASDTAHGVIISEWLRTRFRLT